MSRMLVWSSMLALAACAVGCGGAMGMDRGPVPVVEAPAAPTPSVPTIDSAQIAEELARRPQLPSRPRVAVYFEPASASDALRWRWGFEERSRIVRAGEGEHALELFALPPASVTSSDLHSVRYAAARFGADAVIVVRGAYLQQRRDNLWAAAYALLVPILFAPAQEQETVFTVEATMVDVRNGYLYLAAEGEASQSQQRAHVWVRGEEGVDVSRREATRLLAEELAQRFARIRPAHRAVAPGDPALDQRDDPDLRASAAQLGDAVLEPVVAPPPPLR